MAPSPKAGAAKERSLPTRVAKQPQGEGHSNTVAETCPVISYRLFLAEIAAALDLASALELAPHAFNDSKSRVGSPLGFFSGPGILPILARKLARRGLSPDLTGAFSVPPV